MRGEVAAAPDDAAHAVGDVTEAERLPHHAPGGAEESPGQVVGDDGCADAALQVAVGEGVALQEAEGVYAEEGGVYQLDGGVEVAATVGRLDVGIVRKAPGCVLG